MSTKRGVFFVALPLCHFHLLPHVSTPIDFFVVSVRVFSLCSFWTMPLFWSMNLTIGHKIVFWNHALVMFFFKLVACKQNMMLVLNLRDDMQHRGSFWLGVKWGFHCLHLPLCWLLSRNNQRIEAVRRPFFVDFVMQLLPLLRSMFRLANVIFALASSLAVATQASIEVEIMGLPGVFGPKIIGLSNCSQFFSKCHSTHLR